MHLCRCFLRRRCQMVLAVFCDVGHQMGQSHAYACMLAGLMNEPVYFVDIGFQPGLPKNVRWTADGICQLQVGDGAESKDGSWINLRGVFRYVTRRPWTKLPLVTKTALVNPTVACLAGGRNKLMAAAAYKLFNEQYAKEGLRINTPDTVVNIRKCEVPEYARRMNYKLVVKELNQFIDTSFSYERFIVQNLISHKSWPSSNAGTQLYHHPFFKSADDKSYVTDIRLVICASSDGWMPVAIYSRRAKTLLDPILKDDCPSWDSLGTTLSTGENGTESTDISRLFTFDTETFNKMDLDLDDLVEGYIQTVLAATAIDDHCKTLMSSYMGFNMSLFCKMNPDQVLFNEICDGSPWFGGDMSV